MTRSEAALRQSLGERILILDGAMGTEIQALGLASDVFHGKEFADHSHALAGNNDILTLTAPDAIRDIHRGFLAGGADIITTNTFNATTVSQADYGTEVLVERINREGAQLARQACNEQTEQTGRPCWVAGAMGPTNKTTSISPDVNDPGFRAIDFDTIKEAYKEAARALLAGGADILMMETIFDTLNAKACIFAIEEVYEEIGKRWPIMISGTITDASGRTLTGQTPEAFWYSLRHANPLAFGLNCGSGAHEMRPHLTALAQIVETAICVYPNAGLPNEFGAYDEQPDETAGLIREWAEERLINIVGGCCGTTPEHTAAMRAAVEGLPPRPLPVHPAGMRLSGLEPLVIPS